jgi:hypothetical protein
MRVKRSIGGRTVAFEDGERYYDGDGKPYVQQRRNGDVVVKCYQGDARYRSAVASEGVIDNPADPTRNNANSGLRAVRIPAGPAATAWFHADLAAMDAGSTRANPTAP